MEHDEALRTVGDLRRYLDKVGLPDDAPVEVHVTYSDSEIVSGVLGLAIVTEHAGIKTLNLFDDGRENER